MHILVFSWRDPKHPTAGGAEQVMHEHMKGWVRKGHKVTLFASRIKKLPDEEMLDGVKIVRKADQYIGVKIAAFFYYLRNRKKIDLVVDQFHGIPFFTPLYVNKPIVAVLQEITGKVWFLNELPFPFNYLVGLLGFLAEPFCFLFYKKVHFMVGSKSAKDELSTIMRIPTRNVTVVPHGVIVFKPKPFPKKERLKTIVFLGALAKDKGVEDALKTFALLNKKDNYQYWVIGRGANDYQTYLFSLCERLGIIKKVKFWGYVDQLKKFELLARAHVLINPSAKEGWGLVNIEANAVGTPVVAYQSSGLIDSVSNGKSGYLCTLNYPTEIASKIELILKDENRYHSFQKSSVEWSNGFTWSKSKQLSLKLISKVIGNSDGY